MTTEKVNKLTSKWWTNGLWNDTQHDHDESSNRR